MCAPASKDLVLDTRSQDVVAWAEARAAPRATDVATRDIHLDRAAWRTAKHVRNF